MNGFQKFLLGSGLFIIAIAMLYAMPKEVIEGAFGIVIDDNAMHVFRAIMGLYCGVGFMVLLGARYKEYTRFSLILEAVFFAGIGVGRLISMVVDGHVRGFTVQASVSEILLCVLCLFVLKAHRKSSAAQIGDTAT